MLRRVRHKLRMIRYYSASRQETAWTRAMDVALIASFFLALPATWLCNGVSWKSNTTIDLAGQFLKQSDSSIFASLMMPQHGRANVAGGVPIGNFHLTVQDVSRGWPLTTSVHRLPARLDVDIVREVKPRKNVQLAIDDPLRDAIQAALERDDQDEAIAAWNAIQPMARQHWVSWLIAAGVWWIILAFGAMLCVQGARFITNFIGSKSTSRKAQLRAEGKCYSCGYDMTGLDFNERCPECGELVW